MDSSLHDLNVIHEEIASLGLSDERSAKETQSQGHVHKALRLQECFFEGYISNFLVISGDKKTNFFSLYSEIQKATSIFDINSCWFPTIASSVLHTSSHCDTLQDFVILGRRYRILG